MKLFVQPLQFWPTANSNDVTVILPASIRFLRMTGQGIETFYYDALGSPRVARVDGTGLANGIWSQLLFNRHHIFRVGEVTPGISVAVVAPKERSPARLTKPLAPVQTKCRTDCFTIETGMACDVWNSDDLEAFAIHRSRPELLLQFRLVAYVLTPHEGKFTAVRDKMLADNLSTRNCSLYTVWGPEKRPANFNSGFHAFKTVTVSERNLAANSEWDVRLRRTPLRQQPSFSIEL